MAIERTLAILKPDCVRKNLIGEVVQRIQKAGFQIRAMKMVRLSKAEAEGFYAVHRGRPFFEELTTFMSSGACVPIVLEKDHAVGDFRTLIGATNPAEAAEGTIRKRFGRNIESNAVHGSDAPETAQVEIAHFFSELELSSRER